MPTSTPTTQTAKKYAPIPIRPEETVEINLDQEILKKFRFLARCCQEVAKELGKGHAEKVYQEALSLELQKHGIFHVMEQVLPITYKGVQIGGNHSVRLDVCLQEYLDFIYELKATATPMKQSHLWQLLRYLKLKQYEYGAVVNFNQSQTGKIEMQFVVFIENEYYLYNITSGEGTLLHDFTLETQIDFHPLIVSD